MKLTAITGNLSKPALYKLTRDASDAEYQPLKVQADLSVHDLNGYNPVSLGDLFHQTCAAYFRGKEFPPGGCMFGPFAKTIRRHLESRGYVEFFPEFDLRAGAVTGRADLFATGFRGSAVVEYKVTEMPWEPDAESMVQAASYGYMLPARFRCARTALILCYVDLRRRRVESYGWRDYREAAFRLRELRAA